MINTTTPQDQRKYPRIAESLPVWFKLQKSPVERRWSQIVPNVVTIFVSLRDPEVSLRRVASFGARRWSQIISLKNLRLSALDLSFDVAQDPSKNPEQSRGARICVKR